MLRLRINQLLPLLIVPEGIEMVNTICHRTALHLLLIVPEGIEI